LPFQSVGDEQFELSSLVPPTRQTRQVITLDEQPGAAAERGTELRQIVDG
jgi:hypothetical protein